MIADGPGSSTGLPAERLGAAAGASQSQVAGYESGAVSPTVATLARLLAACGLQARVALEPLHADLDARVDAVLAATAGVPDLSGVEGSAACLAVVLDDAARFWLRAVAVHLPVGWLDAPAQRLADATREPFFTLAGTVQLRLCDALPPHVRLHVPWQEAPVPVATVDAVERHWPVHDELLSRLRARRSLSP